MRFAEIFKTELFSKYGQKAGCYINEIYDIMSAREPESCLQISGERRMAITIAAIAAESSEATNRDIMSAKEKNAAAKQTYSFLAPLTNEQKG